MLQGFSKQYSHTEREVLVGQRRRASLVRNLRTARNRKLSTPGRGAGEIKDDQNYLLDYNSFKEETSTNFSKLN